jgi:GNAT superfamily N-acetyltransferase
MYRLGGMERFGLRYDLESAQDYVLHYILTNDNACFVAEKNKMIVGTLGLSCWQWDLDKSQKWVTEEWMYVDPTERGSNLVQAFLSIAETWAKSKGAITLRMAALENNFRGMSVLYKRKKFDVMFTIFAKEI